MGDIIRDFIVGVVIGFALWGIRKLKKNEDESKQSQSSADANSQDKQRITQIVTEVTKQELVTVACACWVLKEHDSMSNQVIDRYWWYAIGFNKARIYVIPIQISDDGQKSITYQDYFMIEPEQLSLVNGKKGENWVEFYDKEGQKLVSLKVCDCVTHDTPKLFISQKDEAKYWKTDFVPYWMQKVNTANGTNAAGHYSDRQ